MEIPRTNNGTETAQTRQRLTRKTRAALQAEQSALIERLSEVTAILAGKADPKPSQHTPRSWPEDFNLKAYAIGILFDTPDIKVEDLARQLGVSRSTIYSPSWSQVAAMISRCHKTSQAGGHFTPKSDDED